jgi:lysophospholipase L1-like esterase
VIVCFAANPSIDKLFEVDRLVPGAIHRPLAFVQTAGGKGLNVARAAHALDADVISSTHGTNCWTRTPHSVGMMGAAVGAFIDVVRQGHPDTPIVVASPVLRPDAETTPNRLGATLRDLRAAMEEEASKRDVVLVPGGDLIGPDNLADGIHPDDEGHRILANVVGGEVAKALGVNA